MLYGRNHWLLVYNINRNFNYGLMLACSSHFDTAIVGLHKAILNQGSIDFKGLIEPAFIKFCKYFEFLQRRFHDTALFRCTSQGETRPGPSGLLHKPCLSHTITPLHMPKRCDICGRKAGD
jgi:hypothetical protein